MYVCMCHGLTDSQIKEALHNGASTAKDVHAHFQASPRCGKCVPYIGEMVRKHEDQRGCGGNCACAA